MTSFYEGEDDDDDDGSNRLKEKSRKTKGRDINGEDGETRSKRHRLGRPDKWNDVVLPKGKEKTQRWELSNRYEAEVEDGGIV